MTTIQLPGQRQPTPIQSILWLEGEANYTRLHRLGGKFDMITQPLIWFERQLGFIRIHRSAIVNPTYIVRFWQKRSRAGWIQLSNGLVLPVSRSRLTHTDGQLRLVEYQHRVAESVDA